MKITFLTLFPEFYDGFKNTSIIKRALEKRIVDIECVNIRDFSDDKHRRVDDITIGGGPGMILKCEPIVKSIEKVKTESSKVIFLSSKGKKYTQQEAKRLANSGCDLVLLCGHYEGIDERILDYVDEEISIGDYILTGGEIPSLVLADSIIRLKEGTIRKESSTLESFENGLLEYPQYTLPRNYNGKEIPEVLFCGDPKIINKWRLKESLRITYEKRKDLLDDYKFSKEEIELIGEIKENRVGKWEIDAIKKSNKIKVHDIKVNENDYKNILNSYLLENCKINIKINDEVCFINKQDNNMFFYKKVKKIIDKENGKLLEF